MNNKEEQIKMYMELIQSRKKDIQELLYGLQQDIGLTFKTDIINIDLNSAETTTKYLCSEKDILNRLANLGSMCNSILENVEIIQILHRNKQF